MEAILPLIRFYLWNKVSENTVLSCLYKPVRSNILGDNFGTVNTENLYYFNLPFTLEMVQKLILI